MNWNELNQKDQLKEIIESSRKQPVLIFKHSTRCMISSMALNRLERKWRSSNISAYYLDLIAYREISNIVADEFGVQHQSPQVLLISGGDVIHHSSHNGIDFDEINSIAMELPTV